LLTLPAGIFVQVSLARMYPGASVTQTAWWLFSFLVLIGDCTREQHESRAPIALISIHSLPSTSTAVQLACAETFLLRFVTVVRTLALARAVDHCTLPGFSVLYFFNLKHFFSDVHQPKFSKLLHVIWIEL